MAPVIFGLNLGDMQWSKFKSSYMFGNTDYHLRRTKFVVYQLAMIFCVVSESLGTAALSDYVDQQKLVQSLDKRAYVYNNDYIGAASYNIFAGIFTAFIFGAAFFFDLFWPTRREDHGIRVAWKACSVMAVIFQGASAFTLTIITAMHRGYVTGVSQDRASDLLSNFKKDNGSPLVYRHNGRAVAAAVFVWPGWICVILSCVLMFLSVDNAEKGPGPLTKHAREKGTQEPQRDQDHEANFMDLEDGDEEKSKHSSPTANPRAPLPPHEISQAAAIEQHPGAGHQTSQYMTPTAEYPPTTAEEAHAGPTSTAT